MVQEPTVTVKVTREGQKALQWLMQVTKEKQYRLLERLIEAEVKRLERSTHPRADGTRR